MLPCFAPQSSLCREKPPRKSYRVAPAAIEMPDHGCAQYLPIARRRIRNVEALLQQIGRTARSEAKLMRDIFAATAEGVQAQPAVARKSRREMRIEKTLGACAEHAALTRRTPAALMQGEERAKARPGSSRGVHWVSKSSSAPSTPRNDDRILVRKRDCRASRNSPNVGGRSSTAHAEASARIDMSRFRARSCSACTSAEPAVISRSASASQPRSRCSHCSNCCITAACITGSDSSPR